MCTARTGSPIEDLSDRELEVFGLIGQGHGTRQIAEELHLSIKTNESHRAHIKEKLNLKNATLVGFSTGGGEVVERCRVGGGQRRHEVDPDHASLYLLELYPNAPLKEDMARAGWSQAPDDDAAEMYLWSLGRLDEAGYCQYEISNVARPGRQAGPPSAWHGAAVVIPPAQTEVVHHRDDAAGGADEELRVSGAGEITRVAIGPDEGPVVRVGEPVAEERQPEGVEDRVQRDQQHDDEGRTGQLPRQPLLVARLVTRARRTRLACGTHSSTSPLMTAWIRSAVAAGVFSLTDDGGWNSRCREEETSE